MAFLISPGRGRGWNSDPDARIMVKSVGILYKGDKSYALSDLI
jgi:hypothetical protein